MRIRLGPLLALATALTACAGREPAPKSVNASATQHADRGGATIGATADDDQHGAEPDLETIFVESCGRRKTLPEDARAQFELACTRGHGRSCTMFALMAALGEGGPVDAETSHRVSSASCDNGEDTACAVAGLVILRGDTGSGLQRDGRRTETSDARDYFEKGCRAGNGYSCEGRRYFQKRDEYDALARKAPEPPHRSLAEAMSSDPTPLPLPPRPPDLSGIFVCPSGAGVGSRAL